MSMKTISGNEPVEKNDLAFEVTTSEVEAFIQKKFDVMVHEINKNKSNDERQDEVEVTVITTRASSKFYPLMLALSPNVLRGERKSHDDGELSIFNPNHDDGVAALKKPFYDIIKPFMYDDKDRQAFFSRQWQGQVKISSNTAGSLKAYSRPKVHHFNKDRSAYVCVMLDPLRVLHNMMKCPTDTRPYDVWVDRVDQMKGGDYKYYISRSFRKSGGKKKNRGFSMEKELQQAFRH